VTAGGRLGGAEAAATAGDGAPWTPGGALARFAAAAPGDDAMI